MYEVYAQQSRSIPIKADARDATKTSPSKQQSMQFTHRLQLVSLEQLLIQQKQNSNGLHKQLLDSNQNYLRINKSDSNNWWKLDST